MPEGLSCTWQHKTRTNVVAAPRKISTTNGITPACMTNLVQHKQVYVSALEDMLAHLARGLPDNTGDTWSL